MEKEIPLLRAFFSIVIATFIIGSYHLGVVQMSKFCVSVMMVSTYILFVGVSLSALVISLIASVSSFTAELRYYRKGEGDRAWMTWGQNTISSVGLAVSGVIVGGGSSLFAEQAGWHFFLIEFLSFQNLLFVFWRPYLVSYAIAVLLGVVMFFGRKHDARKEKRRRQKRFP